MNNIVEIKKGKFIRLRNKNWLIKEIHKVDFNKKLSFIIFSALAQDSSHYPNDEGEQYLVFSNKEVENIW